jgi:glyoxylase-like metal-dependent hydrolase (beta-lactamase superfamily II)
VYGTANPGMMPAMHRFWLLIAFLLPLSAFALAPVRVADGVYAFIGSGGEPDAANGGNVGNSGFIVGSTGVVVVDTGPSYRHGRDMLAAIRSITDRPVVLAVITHAVQDFVFGAAAFVEAGVPLLAHAKTAELMRSRCNRCLQNLIARLGADAMHGTELVVPQRTFERSHTIQAGGRDIELAYFGWASTPGDVVVIDRTSGVAFAGGLVVNHRVPELRDGELKGWLQALAQLQRESLSLIVPGYGAPGGTQLIGLTSTYLRMLDAQVRALYERGATLTQTVDGVAAPAYADWDQYPAFHRQNALHRFLQLENEELSR